MILRTKGCRKALDYYIENHRPDWSNYLLLCQIGGEEVDPRALTPAHKIGRPHIKAGYELGEGEHPLNIMAACWKHHSAMDLNPILKKEICKQKVDCLHGGVLTLKAEKKKN